jgi:uncharacterized membrane protein YkoI
MTQRTAFVIAAALTAFVLVVGGAVAGQIGIKTSQPADLATAEVPSPTQENEEPEQIEKIKSETEILLEREAALQELVREANARLELVNQERQAAISTVISASQAAEIALASAPGTRLLNPAQLVDLQGILAFEVSLDLGLVYIDANSGEVLINLAVPAPAFIPTPAPFLGGGAGPGRGFAMGGIQDGGGSESGGEHEGNEHDDDHEEHEEEHEEEHDDD